MITQKLIGGNLATEVALTNCAHLLSLLQKLMEQQEMMLWI